MPFDCDPEEMELSAVFMNSGKSSIGSFLSYVGITLGISGAAPLRPPGCLCWAFFKINSFDLTNDHNVEAAPGLNMSQAD